MYADDIVILSSSREGLQRRLDKLESFCKDWCLDVNIDKTKVLIFNKTGKLMKDEFKFDNNTLECVKHYRYLGVYFSVSGIFNFVQDDIYKKASKASFKLTKLVSSSEPSINTSLHLFDHLIKPIVLYGSEIWGMFKTNSSACMRDDGFAFQNIFKNNITDKAQTRYLKYILGVNKYSSNMAVLSETGRYPQGRIQRCCCRGGGGGTESRSIEPSGESRKGGGESMRGWLNPPLIRGVRGSPPEFF